MAFENILVVCVGNICRSPIAVGLLKQQYPNKNIDSAGVSALINHPADQKSIDIMANHGLDITSHRAKKINEDMVLKADLILTMSDSQTKWIEFLWPFCRGKTFKIGHWSGKDIADPYRRDSSAFETAFKDISEGLAQWQGKIG